MLAGSAVGLDDGVVEEAEGAGGELDHVVGASERPVSSSSVRATGPETPMATREGMIARWRPVRG